MHGHRTYQPLSRRGFTLIELVVSIALAGVVSLVSVGLFRAGIRSYNYCYRQTRVISSARKALAGDGSRFGMVWAAQAAQSVDALSASSMTVTPAGDFSTTFLVSGGKLYTSRLATRSVQAESVTGLAVGYYNLDAAGHIMVSTAASAATFVTAQVTMQGALSADKSYTFMSGAQLRNHP